jgi:NAD-dependent SIR2 family protein deacetylase
MLDDTVQVHCKRCRSNFRDRAQRLQPGYSRQCPCCEVVIFFEEDSNDRHVKVAMRDARRLRRDILEAAAKRVAAQPIYDRSS